MSASGRLENKASNFSRALILPTSIPRDNEANPVRGVSLPHWYPSFLPIYLSFWFCRRCPPPRGAEATGKASEMQSVIRLFRLLFTNKSSLVQMFNTDYLSLNYSGLTSRLKGRRCEGEDGRRCTSAEFGPRRKNMKDGSTVENTPSTQKTDLPRGVRFTPEKRRKSALSKRISVTTEPH